MNNLQPEKLNLLDFFKKISSDNFVIPVYQRKYVWTIKKQIKKFLDDYFKVLDRYEDKHFIGIIMYLQIQKRIGEAEMSIVDGQQRIITIFLILEVLTQLCKQSGNADLENEINTQYLNNNYLIDESDSPKLQLLLGDNEILQKIINHKINEITKGEENTPIYQNFTYIEKTLKEKFQKKSLKDMLNALNNFYFVVIPLNERDNPQEIFETINSTGYELTRADLIKNFLLMNQENKKQEYLYKTFWLPLEEKFPESSLLEEFFRMFLANQTFSLSNIEDVYDDFKEWYMKQNSSIDEIMKKIYKYGELYWDLFLNEKFNIEEKVNRSLSEFRKNPLKEVAPLFMEIYKVFLDNGKKLADAITFKKIIDLFITYNIRRNILNLPTGILGRMIPSILKNIINYGSSNFNNIYQLVVKYLVQNNKNNNQFMPDDAYIRLNLPNMNVYQSRKYLKTIFEKIESEDNPAIVNFDNLSIEHLMPQTPTQDWLDYLKVSNDTYEAYLHRLGNLTLAASTDNSKMSNKPFEYKKKILENTSHLKINQEILSTPKWGIEEIGARTKQLIEKIIKFYPYVKTDDRNIEQKYDISLNLTNAKINAIIYSNYEVKISKNSSFYHSINNQINELINNKILRQEKENNFVFCVDYSFNDLKDATLFLLEKNDLNEWELWHDSNGQSLNMKVRVNLKNKK